MKVPLYDRNSSVYFRLLRERRMYSLINLNGSALCFRKMIVSIPVTFSPKFLDFIFVFELF